MFFSEDIILTCLEKKGFSFLCQRRSLDGCAWYEGKYESELYDIEIYSPEFSEDKDLEKYLQSLKVLPEELVFLRRPTHVFEKRGYTFIVRKSKNCQPLTDLLLRPGGVSEKLAISILQSFEVIQSYLHHNSLDNFSPLSVLFQVDSQGQVFLDSFRCGPWIKNFPEVNVIYRYLNPDLSWDKQIYFFKSKLSLKLFFGSPEFYDQNKEFDLKGVSRYLSEVNRNERVVKESISTFVNKKAFSQRFNFVYLVVLLLVILALSLRWGQTGSYWQGLTGSVNKSEIIFDKKEQSRQIVNEKLNQDNDEGLLYELRSLEKQLALGEFNEAILTISFLKGQLLNDQDKSRLEKYQNDLPSLISEDFDVISQLVQVLILKGDYESAISLVKSRLVKFPDSDERKKLFQLLKSIEEEKRGQEESANISSNVAQILHDRKLMKRVDPIYHGVLQQPLRELSLRKRQLDLVKGELKTSAALYLIDCWIECLDAEENLFKSLMKCSRLEKERIFKELEQQVEYRHFTFLSIGEAGFDYRDVRGGATLGFDKLSKTIKYSLFKQLTSLEKDLHHYQLYLYSIKAALPAKAKLELNQIKSVEILAEAARFKDMDDAHFDLWKPLGN